jgi:hypothetical protein
LSPAEAKNRSERIQAIGEQLTNVAAQCEERVVKYSEFEALLDQLHKLGFYPAPRQVHDVAHTIHGEEIARAVH